MRKRQLWAIAMMIVLLGGCAATELKEYQQLTMAVELPKSVGKATESQDLDYLAETEAVLTRRLDAFGLEAAEVTSTSEPERIIVRLPLEVNLNVATDVITRRGQFYLRSEKPGTEGALAGYIGSLQRLLVEQNTLMQMEDSAGAAALQPKIEQVRSAISGLFEPSQLTGTRLTSAKAVREQGNVWAVLIQFDEEGSTLFAEQTKKMAGTGRALGLFLDNVLLSAPVIDVVYAKSGITGGQAMVSGNFTEQAAKDLEIQLNSGALPVYLKAVEVTSTEEAAVKDEESVKEENSRNNQTDGTKESK